MTGLWVAIIALSATPDLCREEYAANQYRDAARDCIAAFASAAPAELPGLYRLAGLSLAAVGDTEQAYQVFVSLLALEPKAKLDDEVSPRVRAPFERAQKARAGAAAAALVVVARPAPKSKQPLRLEVTVDDGPNHPVVRVAAQGPAGVTQGPRLDPTVLELPPPPTGLTRVELSGFDRFGGRLTSVESRFELKPARAGVLSWRLWAAVGAVILAGATASAVVSRVMTNAAQSPDQFVTDAQARVTVGHATAVGADVGFGLGGLIALGAAVLLLTE